MLALLICLQVVKCFLDRVCLLKFSSCYRFFWGGFFYGKLVLLLDNQLNSALFGAVFFMVNLDKLQTRRIVICLFSFKNGYLQ